MLLDLPNELLTCIAILLQPSYQDLLNFALICQTTFYLAEPLLVQSIVVRCDSDVEQLDHLLGGDAIGVLRNNESNNPVTLSTRLKFFGDVRELRRNPTSDFVKSLILALGNSRRKELKTFDKFLLCLKKLTRLEHLELEFPWYQVYVNHSLLSDHNFWDQARQNLAQFLLLPTDSREKSWFSSLRSCHLNLQGTGNETHTLPGLIKIFTARNIQHISIFNADLRETIGSGSNDWRSNLTSLYLEGCLIDSSTILSMLASVCLTKFRLTFGTGRVGEHGHLAWEGLSMMLSAFTALRLYQHQCLNDLDMTWLFGSSKILEDHLNELDLSRFAVLEKTTVRVIASTHITWIFLKLLPDSLRCLRVIDLSTGSDGSALTKALATAVQSDRGKPGSLPKLQTIDLEFSHNGPGISYEDRRQLVELGTYLRQCSQQIRLRVFRSTECHTAMEPYFFDDQRPTLLLVHDNYKDPERFDRMWDTTSKEEDSLLALLKERQRRIHQQEETTRW